MAIYDWEEDGEVDGKEPRVVVVDASLRDQRAKFQVQSGLPTLVSSGVTTSAYLFFTLEFHSSSRPRSVLFSLFIMVAGQKKVTFAIAPHYPDFIGVSYIINFDEIGF